MIIRSLVLGLLITAALCLPQLHSFAGDGETNAEPSTATAPATPPAPIVIPELDELREKLDSIQRANEVVTGKWSALVEQNNALSNVLVGLQETLVSQRKREVELSEQARTFNAQVMIGAGAGVFLIFLASYWFQLRCMNRVMELSRSSHSPALPEPPAPALLEAAGARESKLLEAVKLLENRIQQLEAPASSIVTSSIPSSNPTLSATAAPSENGHSEGAEIKLIEVGPPEPKPAASRVSLLLAKGEILLDMERLQEAVSCFQDALAVDPANAEAHLKKGIALERMNRLELSLKSYEEAVRLNPNRAFAYVHKARVLAALHRYDEALSVYDSALGKNAPKSAATTTTNGR